MRKSARILGHEFGLSAEEMNTFLKQEGFQDGEPGAYGVTEKGKRFSDEKNHTRGVGGYSYYNRSWDTITWDESIADELHLSPERRSAIKDLVATERAERRRAREAAYIEYVPDAEDEEQSPDGGANLVPVIVFAAVAGAVVGLGYGIYKFSRLSGKLWNDQVAPSLQKAKDQITGPRAEESDDCTPGLPKTDIVDG